MKDFLSAVDRGNTCKICSYSVFVLLFGKYLIHTDGDDLTVFILEPETNRRDPAVGIRAGNHLDGNVNA